MTGLGADWSTQQLAEFLAAVSSFKDEASVVQGAIERAAEAFEAEVAAVIRDQVVVAAVGFPQGSVPEDELVALAEGRAERTEIRGLGPCQIVVTDPEEHRNGRLFIARAGPDGFSVGERSLLRAMARVLGLTLHMLERQALLERLSMIQRSISHRAPLPEVLDAITSGAEELLGVEVVGMRLLDPDDPAFALTVSSAGVAADMKEEIRRAPTSEGVGGRAIVENGLVIVEDYENERGMIHGFAARHLQTAMAVPVHENGVVAGSLVVATYAMSRRFTESEQEAMLALAEYASVALTDAKTVEAMREAQRSKDMFLAMVSHELKTPLTVIMGTLRTLEVHGEALPAELREELFTAGWERGKELERLINRLLQGARAELASGEEDVELHELVGQAVRGFEHSRRVVVDVPSRLVVRLDGQAVQEIVGILLENAVSHSAPDSEVRVESSLRGTILSVSVVNTGSLPDELDTAALFQPFQRGEHARSPGVGLGLYIAGRLASSLGGGISVDARDQRVRFTLEAPVLEVGAVIEGSLARPGGSLPIGSPAR